MALLGKHHFFMIACHSTSEFGYSKGVYVDCLYVVCVVVVEFGDFYFANRSRSSDSSFSDPN